MSETLLVTLPDDDWAQALSPLPEGVRARVWDVDSDPREALGEDAERVGYVVLPYMRSAGALAGLGSLPALRLVQTTSAGYDELAGRLPAGVRLANGAGIHDASTSELAVGLALASLRGIDDAVRGVEQADWRPVQRRSLADRRVLLLGVGGIGGAIAAPARAVRGRPGAGGHQRAHRRAGRGARRRRARPSCCPARRSSSSACR